MAIKRSYLTGAILLFGVPAIIVAYIMFKIIFGFFRYDTSDGLAIMITMLYFAVLGSSVSYTSDKVRIINFEGIPDILIPIFKKRTDDGDLINILIIKALGNETDLSQTDISSAMRDGGINLSHQQICNYIETLEKAKLISSPESVYKKQYKLTEQGKIFLQNIYQLFPKTQLFFWYRNGLGRRNLLNFHQNNEQVVS